MVFNANEGYRHTGTEYWIHDFYENQRNATATIPYPYTFPAPTFDDGTPYMCGAENVTHPISPQSVAISTCESARDGGCQSPALYPLLMIASDPMLLRICKTSPLPLGRAGLVVSQPSSSARVFARAFLRSLRGPVSHL
ncbi:lipase_3 domain-containing protein [Pycnococcus provasolii]